ncbi:MAG TPA: FixH family protein [Thermoanaerobaculia bacterium]|nr:FixH family protein [Thermoanaerobaculia bacterium]
MHLRRPSARGHGLRRTVLLLACLAAGCSPAADSASTIALDWRVTPSAPAAGPATVSLTLTDTRSGQPLAGAEVRIEGDMSHPGMKPVFGTAREAAPGRYEAPITFTMAGDWVLVADARLGDGRTFQRQMALRVRPPA